MPPHDVVVVGESLGLLVAERAGRLHAGGAMRLSFGGAESNVAIGVARLGGDAGWVGRLGNDALGELILRELRAERVATYAVRDGAASTALMLKERPLPGESRITYYRRTQAGSRLRPDDIPVDVVGDAKILHVTGITAGLGESPLQALHAAIDAATAAGVRVSFDVNHRSTLWDDIGAARAAYRDLARRADTVFAGADEAELLTGESETAGQLDALLELGADHVVVKLGERGATSASASGERVARDALRVPVVDTVGAGDAFVAGWLSEMSLGAGLEQCLATATACGAFACMGEGDWESAPTREAMERLMRGDVDPVSR